MDTERESAHAAKPEQSGSNGNGDIIDGGDKDKSSNLEEQSNVTPDLSVQQEDDKLIAIKLKLLDKQSSTGSGSIEDVFKVSSLSEDIKSLRQYISAKYNVETNKIRLIFQGKPLKDGSSFESYKITEEKVIHGVITRESREETNDNDHSTSVSNANTGNRSTEDQEYSDVANLVSSLNNMFDGRETESAFELSLVGQNGQVLTATSGVPPGAAAHVARQGLPLPPGGRVRPSQRGQGGQTSLSSLLNMMSDPISNQTNRDPSAKLPRASNGLLALCSLHKRFRVSPYDRKSKADNEKLKSKLSFPLPGFINSCRFGLIGIQHRTCPDRILILEALRALNFLLTVTGDLSKEMMMERHSSSQEGGGSQIAPEIFELCRMSHKLPDILMDLSFNYSFIASGNHPLSNMAGSYFEGVASILSQFSVVCRLLVDRLVGLGTPAPRVFGGSHIDEITREPFEHDYSGVAEENLNRSGNSNTSAIGTTPVTTD